MNEDDPGDEEPIVCDSLAEALAVARALLDEDGEILVHDVECEIDDEGDGCSCEPIPFTVTKPGAA